MSTIKTRPDVDVAEIQGLYGGFSFPEKLLQKIWLRRDFDTRSARLADGRPLRIVSPGKWNLLGGPDFRSARLRFDDGSEISGDVELHLHATDWDLHAHARDPAYDDVLLHVVLFEPPSGFVTFGRGGRPIPILVLLPLLHHSLEEYAADEAVEVLANRPTVRLANELTVYPPEQLVFLLRGHARERWRQKVRFAALRIERLGWEAACHHAALEVLGFRYNRAPMLRVASRWPLMTWADRRVDPETAYASESDAWSLQGVRPANQPRTRLRQYSAWTANRPDWPARLDQLRDAIQAVDEHAPTRTQRSLHQFTPFRKRLADDLCADAIGGTRFDNFVCDAVFPLWAVGTNVDERFGSWYHWFCGDVPPFVMAGLRQLGACDGRDQPACHGLAQGLLGWMIEREVRR